MPSSSTLSTNPYAKIYDLQACRRRAQNSPPRSPLKGLAPSFLPRTAGATGGHASAATATLDFTPPAAVDKSSRIDRTDGAVASVGAGDDTAGRSAVANDVGGDAFGSVRADPPEQHVGVRQATLKEGGGVLPLPITTHCLTMMRSRRKYLFER